MQSSGGVTLSPVSLSHYSFVSNTNKKRRGKKTLLFSVRNPNLAREEKRKRRYKKKRKSSGRNERVNYERTDR